MPVTTVTFDLWETLIADSPDLDQKRSQARVRQIGQILQKVGFDFQKEQIERAHSLVWDECSRFWQQSRDVSFHRQVEIFLDLISPGLAASLSRDRFHEITQIYARAVLLHPPVATAGAGQVLAWFQARGYRLGLICNTGRSPGRVLRKLLARFGFLRYFDCALFSDEAIVRKPDPAIFHLALKEMGAKASEAVHVGDSWENDIQGALAVGMSAMWIGGDPQKTSLPCPASVADLPKLFSSNLQ